MSRTSLSTVVGVLLLAIVGLMAVAASQRARTQRNTATPAARTAAPAQPATPAQVTAAAAPALQPLRPADRTAIPPKPAIKPAPKPQPSFEIASVRPGHTVALRSKPGGRVVASVGATTQFGSPTKLAVAARHGRWLGMTSTDLPNGTLGWVKAGSAPLKAAQTHISIRVDLSRRTLELRDGRKVLRTATVGIGRPGSPTPTGRFSITDKLSGGTFGAFYGCCILALSGHQTNTPAGWQGGDRLAIHGTNDPGSIGVPSSAGCLHADAEDLKVLMRRVPLGTPVLIHA
jgi:lipoprotein-anchoring transpeptidase ErfK/SrfK